MATLYLTYNPGLPAWEARRAAARKVTDDALHAWCDARAVPGADVAALAALQAAYESASAAEYAAPGWRTPRGETFVCPDCGQEHETLYTVRRVLADAFGHFPCYRLNGAVAVLDPTLPHEVTRLPRDARRVEDARAASLWHSNGHYFG